MHKQHGRKLLQIADKNLEIRKVKLSNQTFHLKNIQIFEVVRPNAFD